MSNSMAPSSDLSNANPQQQQSAVRDANGMVTSSYQETVYSGPMTTATHEVTKQYSGGQYTTSTGGVHYGSNVSAAGALQYGSTSAGQSQYTGTTNAGYTTAGMTQYSSVPGAQQQYASAGQYQTGSYANVPYSDSAAYTSTGLSIAGHDYSGQYHSTAQPVSQSQYQQVSIGGHQLLDAGQMQYGYRTSATTGGYATQTGGTRMVSGATETSRVVRTEIGQERVIAVHERVDESRTTVINERYVEHEVKVPKKIVREEVIEKTIVVPEVIRNEEVIEEMQKIREKIVEIAHPIIREKIIEIPEIEYVERVVEVPEKIVQEKIKQVEKVVQKERINEVVKIIPQERVVEVPEIVYRDVPYEVVREVAEWRDEYVVVQKPVVQYVDKPVPEYVNVDVPVDVERHLPIAVEANVIYEYRLPRIKPRYNKITYPVHLPRFVEVPVAVELLNSGLVAQAESYLAQVGLLTKNVMSLCEIENLALNIRQSDLSSQLNTVDLQAAIMKAWQSGSLQVSHQQSHVGMTATTTTTTTTTNNSTAIAAK